MLDEQPLVINCQGSELVGILHPSEQPSEVGAIIIVAGGPQYRVGVNRQFVMMARMFAEQGIPTLRFDHRGIGDSAGEYKGFLDMHADVSAAIDALIAQNPGIKRVALWGECESASAAAFYAYRDPRVSGICMVNPWIRTEEGKAKTFVKHYYLMRLKEKAFWKKVFSGKFNPFVALSSFVETFKKSRQAGDKSDVKAPGSADKDYAELSLPLRLEKTTSLYSGNIYIVTSGHDLIATEFTDYAAGSQIWQEILGRDNVKFVEIAGADHTFSRLEWRNELFDLTLEWLNAS